MTGEVRIIASGVVPAGRSVELDDRPDAFVRTIGAGHRGAPVLLLHGLGATGALNWAPCFEPLAERRHVIALDHRGHGRGPRVGHRFRLDDCADDAAAVLRRLTDRAAIVVGYSMGGPIAQLLAHRHPELVEGLVLSATARDFRGRPADRLRFGLASTLVATSRFVPRLTMPPVPVLPGPFDRVGWAAAELRRHEPTAIIAAAAALGRFTSRAWVSSLSMPAAVLVHTRDRLVPVSRQRRLAQELPHASAVDVDLGHVSVRGRETYVGALVDAVEHLESREPLAKRAA